MKALVAQPWLGARSVVAHNLPGVLVCMVVALAATFLSEHYGGPQLLYALLIGLSLHFLFANPQISQGVNFCAKTVLRAGVALLGARITLDQVGKLGLGTGIAVVVSVAFTLLFGVLTAHLLKRPREEGLLSGGAVGICGASAAMAISSVLPQTKANERFTLLAVVGVTVLSTVAMVIYPFSLRAFDLNTTQTGIFLGGTIHDVAQVVAAGMMVGQDAGEVATVVKLFRVMLLMPIVLVVSFAYGRRVKAEGNIKHKQPALVPGFLLVFIVLVILASLKVFPPAIPEAASNVSRWFLVVAIAGAGLKTSFEDLLKLGWQPVVMLVAETVFIAALVLVALLLFKLGG